MLADKNVDIVLASMRALDALRPRISEEVALEILRHLRRHHLRRAGGEKRCVHARRRPWHRYPHRGIVARNDFGKKYQRHRGQSWLALQSCSSCITRPAKIII